MLLELEMIRGLPVASLLDEAKVGEVIDVVLHPNTGELVGFWVQPDGWFTRKRALSSRDVVGYDPQAIVVSDENVLIDPNEIRSFADIIKEQDSWIGKPVSSQDDEPLGRVTNLVIDSDLEMLAKLEVRTLFGPVRLIHRDAIVKVTPKQIVVKDSSERAPAAAVPAEETA